MKENYLILDTETTGIGKQDEVLELGIIDMDGNTIYHSLFNPSCPIGTKASEIHGISMEEVKEAPQFPKVWQQVKDILAGSKILIYNSDFDVRMLNQTARIYGLGEVLNKQSVRCVMKGYARYHGQRNPKTGDYRWIKLEQALQNEGIPTVQNHRAIGDCLMTLALIKKVGKVW